MLHNTDSSATTKHEHKHTYTHTHIYSDPAIQQKCDQLIVFAREMSQDASFSSALHLLRTLVVKVECSTEDIRARYDYLLRSGKAERLRQGEAMQAAVRRAEEEKKARTAAARSSGSGGSGTGGNV